ncbi:MAG: phosphodiester glycosidase family protein [Thermodesulfobacteriota bacterium]
MKSIKWFIILSLFIFSPPLSWGQDLPLSGTTGWRSLAPGLSWLRWVVREERLAPNTLAILRIDPEIWAFRVFYNLEPKTLKEWQQSTKAVVVCNGGFYRENFQPAGRILVNGTSLGPTRNRYMKGMFLAEPRKGLDHLPKATLIDLKEPNSEEKISLYEQGIQSFPILLDSKGQVRVNPSSFQANRTIVAEDPSGFIYLIITEKPSFTLHDFGVYLKNTPFRFRFVLNLDGGYRTQLAVRINSFNYFFAGQGENKEVSRLFAVDPVRLPSVIGIFPRGR